MKQTNLEWLLSLEREDRIKRFIKAQDDTAEDDSSYKEDAGCFIDWLASPHIEPIRLTAEEWKAAELAVAIGLPWISREMVGSFENTIISSDTDCTESYGIRDMPNVRILYTSKWLTSEPLDLREILKADSNG